MIAKYLNTALEEGANARMETWLMKIELEIQKMKLIPLGESYKDGLWKSIIGRGYVGLHCLSKVLGMFPGVSQHAEFAVCRQFR